MLGIIRISLVISLSLSCFGCAYGRQNSSAPIAESSRRVLDVAQFGAKGDGESLNTAAFQAAIDACKGPGAVVRVSQGQYVTGTIKLKSNVELHVAEGAEILGSLSLDDYARDIQGAIEAPAFDECLIYAENSTNIKITGKGIINGRGTKESFPVKIGRKLGDRPMLIRFVNCNDVSFSDITLKNAASWCTHMVDCDDIIIRNVTLDNHVNTNNDGFDLDGCKNILIEDCNIRSGDDSICPKSTTDRLTENLVVRNCRVQSNTAAFKCGTSSHGGFRNIRISDCDFSGCRMGVIKLLTVDGGILEDVHISNITMNNVEGPIFIRLGNRGRQYDKPTEQIYSTDVKAEGAPVGSVRNIRIRNITATVTGDVKERQGIMISGIPGHKIEDVVLENLDITFTGNGTAQEAEIVVPEDIARYPEQFFFGVLPSWGMYLRHVDGMVLKDVDLSLSNPDQRPKIVCEDVSGFRVY